MEKRFFVFIVLSVAILVGWQWVMVNFIAEPPKDRGADVAERRGDPDPDAEIGEGDGGEGGGPAAVDPEGDREPGDDGPTGDEPDGETVEGEGAADPGDDDQADDEGADDIALRPAPPEEFVTLGSFAKDTRFRLLVILNNRGAGIERVEMVERGPDGRLRYRDLERDAGYLGYIAAADAAGGCRVRVLPPGTPAALARSESGEGLKVGDVILAVGDDAIAGEDDLDAVLERRSPGEEITLVVRREGVETPLRFQTTLARRPLALISEEAAREFRPAMLTSLVGLQEISVRGEERELSQLPSLREGLWEVVPDNDPDEVMFRFEIPAGLMRQAGGLGSLVVLKRFRLAPVPADDRYDPNFPGYHLDMELEFQNGADQPQAIQYMLEGPNALPIEGWWYSYKIHPKWGSAGARDVIWRIDGRSQKLRGTRSIYKHARKDPDSPADSIITANSPPDDRTLQYIGIDTQYFAACWFPGRYEEPGTFLAHDAYSIPVGDVPKLKGKRVRTLNTSFLVMGETDLVPANGSRVESFHVFLGPKRPELLEAYELGEAIERGWFGWVAKPLSRVLHFFYRIVGNYGLAIIMLTILVRGALFPLGRQAARNAAMMQELAPEIAKIKEKHKNDLEKQAAAQRELWKQHNFNPFSGCWVMLLQLPIFMGLYRALVTDIELRQAPLIPGLDWASNLAGPDMLFRWDTGFLSFLTSESGWLGPYFNLLPVLTIVLFLVQQKMFSPPATDEQTRMTQRTMTIMMVFIGFMFFKVASGLCVYFIASSLWGIGERKLVPKPKIKTRGGSSSDDAGEPKSTRPESRRSGAVSGSAKTKGGGKQGAAGKQSGQKKQSGDKSKNGAARREARKKQQRRR